MSHGRVRSRFGYGMWKIRKPFDLKVGDLVLSHGDGRITYPSKITAIDATEVELDGTRKLTKNCLLAKIEHSKGSAPLGIPIVDIKDALDDYGRLRVQTYADWAKELRNG